MSRTVARVVEPQEVTEGAGVRLHRSIGTRSLNYLDPFLLLDHFSSKNPKDYQAGFPLHPHRGIETVTYLLAGEIRHKDTLGNAGSIGAGDVQWMTAGGGILHEEMPQVRPEGNVGFQLWVNLPAKLKMMAPRYQEIRARDIPQFKRKDGSVVRLIAGVLDGTCGPVKEIAADPFYADVSLPAGAVFQLPIPRGHTAFAYLFEGEAAFADSGETISATRLVVWNDGNAVVVTTSKQPARFLLVSGKPLREPIARHGPFVMNTREEIEQALRDLDNGTFDKSLTHAKSFRVL